MSFRGISLLDKSTGRDALKRACRKAGVKVKVIEDLVTAELDQTGRVRKRGLMERIDEILASAEESET
jgi:hypothetical protein